MFIAVVIPIGLLSTVSVVAADQSDFNPSSSEASFQTILTNGLVNSSEHMKNVKNDVFKHEANKSEFHEKDEAMSGTTTPPNVNLTTTAPNKYKSLLNRRKALIGEYLKEYQNIYKANRNARSSTSKEHKRSYENDFTAPHFSYDYVDDNTFEERQRRRNLKNDDVRGSETEVKISYGNSDIDLSKEKNRSANNNKCNPSSRGNCSYTPETSYSSETANGKHCKNNKCNTFPDINIHRKTQKCGPLGDCSNEAQNGKQKHFDSNDRFPQKGKNDVKEDSENQMQEILNGKLANKIVDNVILRMHSNKELRFHFGSEVAKYDYGYSPDHWTGLSGSSFVLQETNYRSRIDIAMTKIKNILGHLVDQEVQRKSCNILQPDLKKFLLWLLEVQNHAKKKTYFNKENFLFHYQDFTGTNNEQANEFDKQLKLPPFYRHTHQNESRNDTLTVRNFLNISVTPSSHPQLHDIANTQQISLKNKSENPSVLSEDASGTLQTDEVQVKLPRSKENILPATNNTIQNGPEQQLIKKMLSSLGLVPSSRKRRLT